MLVVIYFTFYINKIINVVDKRIVYYGTEPILLETIVRNPDIVSSNMSPGGAHVDIFTSDLIIC